MSGRAKPPSPEAVGAALSFRAARLAMGLSQVQLGRLAGVDRTTVSKIERGMTVQVDVMRMVAAVLQLRESWTPTYQPRGNRGRFGPIARP